MIAIKDMEMPSCCNECPMYQSEDSDYCDITGAWIKGEEMKRHNDCPLVEIVSCKDCSIGGMECSISGKYCIHIGKITEDDFFCKYGERKE